MKLKISSKSMLTVAVLAILAVVPTALLGISAPLGSHSMNPAVTAPREAVAPNLAGPVDQLGIDCGLGTTAAVPNATGFVLAPTEVGTSELLNRCTWIGDAGQTVTGSYDSTNEPLVTDQDENLPSGNGGGFTANVVLLQNLTSTINGFDLQVQWNPAVLSMVRFDQSGLRWNTGSPFTAISTIDNVNGVAELGQVITGTLIGGNLTLFRMRFDVVGIGVTKIHIVDVSGGIVNPGAVAHQNVDNTFDSETFFDPGHTLNWKANFTLPSPLVPGSPNTFKVNTSCPGCTGALSYQWQFNSTNTAPFKTQATGNPVTITVPSSAFLAFSLTVVVKDSATPTPNNITLTIHLPLTATVEGPATIPIASSASWRAAWIGGNPPYTGTWRLCPGTATTTTVCSNPNPRFTAANQTFTQSLNMYNFAGVFNDTLKITDAGSPALASASTTTAFFLVNVTGATPAYTVTISPSTSLPSPGGSVTIVANIAYNAAYPITFKSSTFTYNIAFGDGTSNTITGGTTITTTHSYSSSGSFTIRILAQETGSAAVSRIEEAGFSTISVAPPLAVTINPSVASTQTGQSVTFTPSITGGTGSYTYSWDFGDGTTSTSMTPTHSYSTAGSFNVTLTVKDSAGRTFATSQAVTITSPNPGTSILLYAGVAVAVVAVIAATFLLLRKRKSNKLPAI